MPSGGALGRVTGVPRIAPGYTLEISSKSGRSNWPVSFEKSIRVTKLPHGPRGIRNMRCLICSKKLRWWQRVVVSRMHEGIVHARCYFNR